MSRGSKKRKTKMKTKEKHWGLACQPMDAVKPALPDATQTNRKRKEV